MNGEMEKRFRGKGRGMYFGTKLFRATLRDSFRCLEFYESPHRFAAGILSLRMYGEVARLYLFVSVAPS